MMRTRDSYEALAVSIERTILSDLAPTTARPELAPTIEQTLLEEARANEIRFAGLRVIAVAAYLTVALFGMLRAGVPFPPLRLTAAILGGVWLALAGFLAMRLRHGWCPKWLQYLGPALDGTMIWVGFIVAAAEYGRAGLPVPTGVLVCVAILCVLLTVSGALRLSRSSAELSTALAIAIFVYAAVGSSIAVHHLVLAAGTILLIGVLGASVATLVKRIVTSQVERATLSSMYHEAQQTIDAREQVLKIVSHDLRNPLHTISMCASLLLDVPMQPGDQSGHLQRIKRAGERMNRLVQ
ncbi:MAG TPA: histidine kinase dimerization/phospho-acceptor domain-containing protein, partial [Gemmatimonadaceae bacterium]|nr:histidine kinase dimerization/phospho-acceptor domain-containing protein [Gemmatimonadaceae bacterium]